MKSASIACTFNQRLVTITWTGGSSSQVDKQAVERELCQQHKYKRDPSRFCLLFHNHDLNVKKKKI